MDLDWPVRSMITFRLNNADREELSRHLLMIDEEFLSELRRRTNLEKYVGKLVSLATNFEAWDEKNLVGLVSVYANDPARKNAFITNVSVHREFQGRGIATSLIKNCLEYIRLNGFSSVSLEVSMLNEKAIHMYVRRGFVRKSCQVNYWELELTL